MKGRAVLIQETGKAIAAALVENGVVQDLIVDPMPADVPPPGSVWRARVLSKGGGGGVFVDLEGDGRAFLRGAKLAPGDRALVQITGFADPGKAPPATDRLLVKGQLTIATPGAPGINISRSIRNEDLRERLTEAVHDALDVIREGAARGAPPVPEDLGIIVRSAANADNAGWIANDLAGVLSRLEAAQGAGDPGQPAIDTALTEWAHPHPGRILVDVRDDAFADRIEGLQRIGDWDSLVEETRDPFDRFGIWETVEELRRPEAPLPGGGSMMVEATTAMVTVDVNTGDRLAPDAALGVNLAAARELPRQLRLRGLGGAAIIDFAPLRKAHRRKIEDALKAAFRRDPVQTTLAGWTPLGNFELQRKRERRPLA